MRLYIPALAACAVALALPASTAAQRLGPEVDVAAPMNLPTGAASFGTAAFDGAQHVVGYTDRTTPWASGAIGLVATTGTRTSVLPLDIATYWNMRCAGGRCVGARVQNESGFEFSVQVQRFRTDSTSVEMPVEIAGHTGTEWSGNTYVIRVAVTATGYVAVWSGAAMTPTPGLFLSVFPATGAPSVTVPLSTAAPTVLDVNCHGDVCLAGWGDGAQLFVQRVSGSGALIDAAPVPLASALPHVLRIADSGVDFAVASFTQTVSSLHRIGYDGAHLENGTPAVSMSSDELRDSVLACDGAGGCVISEQVSGTSYREARRLSWWQGGVVTVGPSDPLASWSVPPRTLGASCHAPGRCVGFFVDVDAFAARPLQWTGTSLTLSGSPVPFGARGADLQDGALASASDGSSHLVAFSRRLATSSTAGATLGVARTDGRSAPTTPGADVTVVGAPDLARGAGEYGLVVQVGSTPHFYRLDDAGTPVFGPLVMSPGGTTSAIAWNGVHYLVAWGDAGGLRVQRLDALGQRVDELPRTVRTGAVSRVDVAWDGAQWILAARGGTRVMAIRLMPSGEPIDPSMGILIRDHVGDGVAIANGGPRSLVVWREDVATDSFELRGARLAADGTVLDIGGTVLATGPAFDATSVAYDGASFVAAWTRRTWLSSSAHVAVQARLVAPTGTMSPVVDVFSGEDPFNSLSARVGVAVSALSPSRVLVSYVRPTTERDFAPMRVRARELVDDLLGAACSTGADCASGHCAAGVCCDRACDGACEACGAGGVCGASAAGTTCRGPAGACDHPELCDGLASTCPPAIVDLCDGGFVEIDAGGGDDDAGTADEDAGAHGDAGSWAMDAGPGEDDGGATPHDVDAGTPDGGMSGGPDAGAPATGGGCTASGGDAGSASGSVALLMLVMSVIPLRRRHRRR